MSKKSRTRRKMTITLRRRGRKRKKGVKKKINTKRLA